MVNKKVEQYLVKNISFLLFLWGGGWKMGSHFDPNLVNSKAKRLFG